MKNQERYSQLKNCEDWSVRKNHKTGAWAAVEKSNNGEYVKMYLFGPYSHAFEMSTVCQFDLCRETPSQNIDERRSELKKRAIRKAVSWCEGGHERMLARCKSFDMSARCKSPTSILDFQQFLKNNVVKLTGVA